MGSQEGACTFSGQRQCLSLGTGKLGGLVSPMGPSETSKVIGRTDRRQITQTADRPTAARGRPGERLDTIRPCDPDAAALAIRYAFGLYESFRQPRGKPEGPQHFAFPEISRETRGCLVLHSGNSRVSLSLRAGLGQNLRQNRGNRQNYRVFSRYTRGVSGLPAKYPGICRLGLFWDQTSLRLGSEPGKFDGFPGN